MSTTPKFTFGGFRYTKETAALVEQRRDKIVEMRDSGMSFGDIAKSFGISKSRCSKIYKTAVSKSKSAYSKPKSLKVASFVKDTIRSYLPFLILKDGKLIKINYRLLFLILSSKKDYFKSEKSKTYVMLIFSSLKTELMIAYNKLLLRFGETLLAEEWVRRLDNPSVPNCFWKDEKIENFLLKCELLGKHPSKEVAEGVLNIIESTRKNSPSFDLSNDEILGLSKDQRPLLLDSLLRELDELDSYIQMVKEDTASKREDYISVLDTALSCMKKIKEQLSCHTAQAPTEETSSGTNDVSTEVSDSLPKVKAKPKAFWPKPVI